MAKLINVCVVALTQADRDKIEPVTFRDRLLPADGFDFDQAGSPYAVSPDDWQPFESSKTIAAYFGKDLQPTFLSSFLLSGDLDEIGEILERADLYIIDPLFLMHAKLKQYLTGNIQTVIRTSKKNFCIIVPKRASSPIREELAKACAEQLTLLQKNYVEGYLCEWEVHAEQTLRAYLAKVARALADAPNSETARLVTALFGTLKIPSPDIREAPRMNPQ